MHYCGPMGMHFGYNIPPLIAGVHPNDHSVWFYHKSSISHKGFRCLLPI